MDTRHPDSTPAPAPTPTPVAPPGTSRRHWRSTLAGTLAGAVAGGVLAGAVAAPITWAAVRGDAAAPATRTTAGTTTSAPADDVATPPWAQVEPGTAGTTGTTGTATDAQSQGVVLIDTTLTDGAAAGTGLVLDASGLVLTNYHVIEGSTSVTVTVATDGTRYDADVLGYDESADVALLQLEDAAGLAVITVDDDADPAVADTVTAVGNAEGQGSLSVSTGTVVALGQSITTAATAVSDGEDLRGLIQTDAYVVGGYSGGALLDDEGEVVGITTAASQAGPTASYAVPLEDALQVAAQIEAGDETGGVQVGPAAYLGLGIVEAASGAQVAQVESRGPAARAGVEVGDRIVALGGHGVTSLDTLRAALAAFEPGDRVSVRWTDGSGATRRGAVTLAESPVS